MFTEYQLPITQLKETTLRSTRQPTLEAPQQTDEVSTVLDFAQPDSVCAVAPGINSSDPVWFVKIKSVHEALDEDEPVPSPKTEEISVDLSAADDRNKGTSPPAGDTAAQHLSS